jgi:uncharacterized protein YdeI (YjbR/CyaY-like superfamily)
VFHKKKTGKPSLVYEDAVEEALCFGWIDSLVKRVDDGSYVWKFTPRKANEHVVRFEQKTRPEDDQSGPHDRGRFACDRRGKTKRGVEHLGKG